VNFRPWCLKAEGEAQDDTATPLLAQKHYRMDDVQAAGVARTLTLREIMRELGHEGRGLRALKLDIEGHEWPVLLQDVLGLAARPGGDGPPPPKAVKQIKPPLQLHLEIHAEGSNEDFVPPSVVQGRDPAELRRLFTGLFNAGYRVVSADAKGDDPVAEWSLAHVPGLARAAGVK